MKIVGQTSLQKLKEELQELGHKINIANDTYSAAVSFISSSTGNASIQDTCFSISSFLCSFIIIKSSKWFLSQLRKKRSIFCFSSPSQL